MKNERNNITEYMSGLVAGGWKNFEWAYTKKDLLNQLQDVQNASRSAKFSRIERLRKSLEASGIQSGDLYAVLETKMGAAKLKKQIENSPVPEDAGEIEKNLFKMLYEMYKSFPAAENFMQRLVRRLADEEFQTDSVRVAIVKQFMKHTSYQTAAVKKIIVEKLNEIYPDQKKFDMDTILFNIDESIFEQAEIGEFPLLKLADDLSSGKFRTNGRTRKDLYMFAFAFNMTSTYGKDDLEYDERTDIEKNLFQDYYNDNLLRYISDCYMENAKRFQAEPLGDGVNFKNFVEVIYLYHLNQDGMDAKEKIREAESLIKEVKKYAANEPEGHTLTKTQETQFFQNIFNEKQICKLSRDELKKMILEGGYMLPAGIQSSADITIDDETRTAARNLESIYKRILEFESETHPDSEAAGSIYERALNIYADFSEKTMVKDYSISMQEILMDYRHDKDFVILIQKLDEKLDIAKKIEALQKNAGTQENKEVHVTRNDLIAAGFYYFQLKHMEYNEDENILSLNDIYEEFRDFIDGYLEESRFQKLNPKNIFDVYVVSALYQSVNFG